MKEWFDSLLELRENIETMKITKIQRRKIDLLFGLSRGINKEIKKDIGKKGNPLAVSNLLMDDIKI